MSFTRTARRRLGIAGGALLAAGLSGCSAALLDPHGPIGRQEKLILIDSTVIMLAIVIPVIIATLAFAWWYRVGNPKARRLPEWDYSHSNFSNRRSGVIQQPVVKAGVFAPPR